MENFERDKKMNNLAVEILKLSRNTLMVNLRFLDMALSQLEYVPITQSTIMTNGKEFFYNPAHVLKSYKTAKEQPVREYLHILMHCIFRHMYMSPTLNRAYWDLACDIAAENVINELDLKSAASNKVQMQAAYIEKLKKEIKFLTAEKIYVHLKEANLDELQIAALQELFCADDHMIWYVKDNTESSKNAEQDDGESEGMGQEDGESEGMGQGDGAKGSVKASRKEIEQIWQKISRQIQVELETLGQKHKNQGAKSGALIQNLAAVNREKYNYEAFLKKFAVMGEVMKINDDEFDYIFYTYGLKLYEKMPLIEPLEYKEEKRIKEFVIAIDTSGSTSGELVQKFIQKTYNVLKSTESFFSKINLHIIQCDAEIQEDVKITCQQDFDEYIKNMKLRGLGGTDFRPVFAYVDKLVKNKEFTNLKGLIYFTDGYGEYPAGKPNYDTAFVFIDDEYNNPDVPPWAIKLVLQKDEI